MPPVYISTTGSSSSGSAGTTGSPADSSVFVGEVVGVAIVVVTDQDHVLEVELTPHAVERPPEVLGEHGVDEDDAAARVADDVHELGTGQAEVERGHDTGAEERGVVQLEELVRVQRHHGEAVIRFETELVAQGIGQPQHPVAVAGHGALVVAVEEGHLVGVALHRRQQDPRVHQLLHRAHPPGGLVRTGHDSPPSWDGRASRPRAEWPEIARQASAWDVVPCRAAAGDR